MKTTKERDTEAAFITEALEAEADAEPEYAVVVHPETLAPVPLADETSVALVAARLGRTIRWDPQAEKIVGDEQAASFFARVARKGYEIPRV